MESFEDKDYYGIKVKDGINYLTYKGEILPHQTESIIIQKMHHIKEDKNLCEVQIKVLTVLEDTK